MINQLSQPLISVIIPTHNRPDFLRKTIQSILDQTYSNIEIIIISNGYNIENAKVAASFLDPKIIYVEQENSGGPASPRNHGIRIAKGEFIAFCDDDDLWMPDKLTKQAAILLNNATQDVCYTKMLRFDETNKEWSVAHEECAADLSSLLYVNTVPISSLMIKKKLMDQIGGFCESKIVGFSEDYEFILRCAGITKFAYIDEYLIKYWSGNNRTTFIEKTATTLHHLCYLKGIMGCYYLQIINNNIKLRRVLLPLLYQIKITCKILLYMWFINTKKLFKTYLTKLY